MTEAAKPVRVLTGRHVLVITVSAFAVIIGVNLTMAFKAVSTFPGLEVKSSYVAGQGFNARRNAQEALHWQIEPAYASGQMRLAIRDAAGQPVQLRDLSVLIGRTTHAAADVTPVLLWQDGVYQAPLDLQAGQWMLKLAATAQDGTPFEKRVDFFVKE